MFNRLSYHYLLALMGLVLLILLVFSFHMWKVIEGEYKSVTLLSHEVFLIDTSDEILAIQKKNLNRMKKASKAYDYEAPELNNSTQFISYLEEKSTVYRLRLISLPRESEENFAGHKILEERFSLEGNLSNMLRLLYDLEHKERIGSLIRLDLRKESLRNQGMKMQVLIGDICLKRLINT